MGGLRPAVGTENFGRAAKELGAAQRHHTGVEHTYVRSSVPKPTTTTDTKNIHTYIRT